MAVHIHPSVDSGVKQGSGSFAGGTLVCKCKDKPVKVAISGDKLQNKFAYRHSGFPGGLRARSLGDELQKHADRVVEKAIIGMLPHNKLSRQVQKKLRVYVGPEHPHTAQQPIPFEIKQVTQ